MTSMTSSHIVEVRIAKRRSGYEEQVLVQWEGMEDGCFDHVITSQRGQKMALCNRGRHAVLVFLLLVLSFVHSSLIPDTCKDWDKKFVDVDFGEFEVSESNCGEQFDLEKFSDSAPAVTYSQADPDEQYAIAMVDPDAPSADDPKCKSWLHWIIGNIKGGDLETGNINGKTLTAYNPPSPPEGYGPHRYYLFLFKQEHSLDDKAAIDSNKRCHFSIDDYKDKFNLTPVAMNMFKTENKP